MTMVTLITDNLVTYIEICSLHRIGDEHEYNVCDSYINNSHKSNWDWQFPLHIPCSYSYFKSQLHLHHRRVWMCVWMCEWSIWSSSGLETLEESEKDQGADSRRWWSFEVWSRPLTRNVRTVARSQTVGRVTWRGSGLSHSNDTSEEVWQTWR